MYPLSFVTAQFANTVELNVGQLPTDLDIYFAQRCYKIFPMNTAHRFRRGVLCYVRYWYTMNSLKRDLI